jgi:hypothetical protein
VLGYSLLTSRTSWRGQFLPKALLPPVLFLEGDEGTTALSCSPNPASQQRARHLAVLWAPSSLHIDLARWNLWWQASCGPHCHPCLGDATHALVLQEWSPYPALQNVPKAS